MSGDRLRSTIYAERYLNDSKGEFSGYSEVDPLYDPQGPTERFALPFVWLGSNECTVYTASPDAGLKAWVGNETQYRFFWHPDVVREGFAPVGSVLCQPTSSTRTVLTEESFPVYIKTDLDKKHFRFIRRLKRDAVEHSVAISRDLTSFCGSGAMPPRYGFLPESIGVVVDRGPHSDCGVIYREVDPFPRFGKPKCVVPYHALYAEDPAAPFDPPLCVQIVRIVGDGDPLAYFVRAVIGPILEAWVGLVSRRGLLPELHGQNALVEIDADLELVRLVHRDFQGTYSDSRLRAELGLPQFSKHVAGMEVGTTLKSQYSHVFDGMIGRYLLSRLCRAFCRYFPYEYNEVTAEVRAYHRSLPGWDRATFPETTYRFATGAREQVGNDIRLEDTGLRPDFR